MFSCHLSCQTRIIVFARNFLACGWHVEVTLIYNVIKCYAINVHVLTSRNIATDTQHFYDAIILYAYNALAIYCN